MDARVVEMEPKLTMRAAVVRTSKMHVLLCVASIDGHDREKVICVVLSTTA